MLSTEMASTTICGATTIAHGVLALANNNALGSTSGVTASAADNTSGVGGIIGSRVELQNVTITGIPLTLNSTAAGNLRSGLITTTAGTNTWTGSITLQGDGITYVAAGDAAGEDLVISGTITGNAYTGDFKVRSVTGAGVGNGTLSGMINLGTANFFKDDLNNWTISSTGNVWGVTQIGLGSLTVGGATARSALS